MPPATPSAVFLSYASEDAQTARRICDALRAAGLEVWFDQNELRGGDAWDAKIRQQIRECALFVAIISASTQARREGYFRIEWKLAAQRTHAIADGTPFLLPLVIDDTPEPRALVPAEFREVQWTRLLAEDEAKAFSQRVRALLEWSDLPAPPFPATRVAAGQPASRPGRGKRWPWFAAGATAAVAVALVIGWPRRSDGPAEGLQRALAAPRGPAPATSRGVDPKSVAVLAFQNLSGDQANESFSDGISEELLNVLARVPGLRVAARTSSFYFKGRNVPPREIAQQLGVAHLIEGTVRRMGDRVRITAKLINAADGFTLWTSENLDRDLRDIFALQDEIAGTIAKSLSLSLGSPPRSAAVVIPEAHRLVLEGRHFWGLRTMPDLARAETAFAQALKIDPQFALAHAGLADNCVIRAFYQRLDGVSDVSADLARGRAAARRALALDSSLPEPTAALAYAALIENDAAGAEELIRPTLAANPNYANGRQWHAVILGSRGRLEAAIAEAGKAVELDPLSFINLHVYGKFLAYRQRYAEAQAISDRAVAIRGEKTFLPHEADRAVILLHLQRKEEAAAIARAVLRNPKAEPRWYADGDAVWVLRQAGFAEEAATLASGAMAAMPPESYQRGFVLAALGRWEEAERFLQQTPRLAYRSVFWAPLWDPFRDSVRFQALLTALGWAEDYGVARAPLR